MRASSGGSTVHLGVCGPIETAPLAAYLDRGSEALPPGMGGTPVVALVRAALQKGWKVTVFSLDPSLREERIAAGSQLKLYLGPYRPCHNARDLFLAERRYLSSAIAREKPDVVHGHWTYEFALGVLDSGLPAVITAHDRPFRVLRWNFTPYRIMKTVVAGIVARRAKCLTAVSAPVATHLERYFHPRGPVHVIPNCLAEEWFAGTPSGVRRGSSFTFVAALTGWGPLKNGRVLLEAFARIRTSLDGARLLLFGNGHGPGEDAEAWAVRRNLDRGVEFVGQVSQSRLREAMRSADILVHPSREESLSMVIAEAMASGLPVIAIRGSGGIHDTLADGHAVLLSGGSSAAELAADMLRLAQDPTLRDRLARAAQEAARRCFAPAEVLEAYAGLYRSSAVAS